MDGYVAVTNYLNRIVQGDGKCVGSSSMKALLLDAATTQTVSAVYSQTEILRQHVYLVTKLGGGNKSGSTSHLNGHHESSSSNNNNTSSNSSNSSGDTSHLKAIVFVRPTAENIDALVTELSTPTFVEYHVFFSGMLDSGLLRKVAEHDIYEKVIQVQELYADFVPINEDLVTLQCRNTISMSMAAGTSWAPNFAVQYERNLVGVQSLLLAFKKQPVAIRYTASSPCAEELAKDIHDAISSDELFHFRNTTTTTAAAAANRKKGQPVSSSVGASSITTTPGGSSTSSTIPSGGMVLLILDRRDDPVTPLLSQWTYQAMVHELLGLNNHRVVLKGAPNISKELEEVVLNASDDEFFKANRHANFGELGEAIQHLLQDYQHQTAAHKSENLNTIEQMQAFMEKFPELRSRSHTVSKHVAIMGELARLVEVCLLMDVSQFEQSLACNDDHNSHWRELMEKLSSPQIKIPDKLRLGLLYALRYEVAGNIHMVQQAMSKGGVSHDMVNLVPALLRYAGVKSRGPGLYGENDHLMSKMTKSFITTVQGIQNVYSQHVPLVMDIVQSLMRGKLSSKQYPILPSSSSLSSSHNYYSKDVIATMIPDEVIVFIVGGVTYEEGTKIAELNNQQSKLNRGVRVIIGGSTVHNSTSFLDELKASTVSSSSSISSTSTTTNNNGNGTI